MERQGEQGCKARDYLLQALEIFVAFEDIYYSGVTLGNLARLWRESGDSDLPGLVAEKIGVTRSEAEERLHEMLEVGKSGEER